MMDVEQRWSGRRLDALHAALVPVAYGIARPLPEYFPVLDNDFRAPVLADPVSRPPDELGLLGLLSKVSLALTYDFEAESPLSLGMCANVLRPLGSEPVAVRDLPDITGAAKRVWSAAIPRLEKLGLTVAEAAPSGRGQCTRLTDSGIEAQRASAAMVADVNARWRERGGVELASLRTEVESIVGDGRPGAPVFEGLTPYPECWRAKLRPISALPHQPLVMHRGRQLTHASSALAMSSMRTTTVGSTRSIRILGGRRPKSRMSNVDSPTSRIVRSSTGVMVTTPWHGRETSRTVNSPDIR